MKKIRRFSGNLPPVSPLQRFAANCPHCDEIEFWSLCLRDRSGDWYNLKLVAEKPVCIKANYWLTARFQFRLDQVELERGNAKRLIESPRHKDSTALRLHRKRLYASVVAWLDKNVGLF
jgi:hypothetical protein